MYLTWSERLEESEDLVRISHALSLEGITISGHDRGHVLGTQTAGLGPLSHHEAHARHRMHHRTRLSRDTKRRKGREIELVEEKWAYGGRDK